MGGGLAGGPLAGAVAKAGGPGTLGLALPSQLRKAIDHVSRRSPRARRRGELVDTLRASQPRRGMRR